MEKRLGNIVGFLTENLVGILKLVLIVYAAVFLVVKFGAYVWAYQQNSPQITSISLVPKDKDIALLQIQEQFQIPQERSAALSNQIFIPKLQIQAPIIEAAGTSNTDFIMPLKKGVALYPLSKPGQMGRTVILGHSAPPNWPKINYDWIFSHLGDIGQGDEIKIVYEGKEYIYVAKNKIILKKGRDLPPPSDSAELALITCWPPGIDYQRLAVFAELKDIVVE